MQQPSRQIPFQVDIAGVIEILGSALYSRPDTAVRELIQNAHDAITRRRHRDLGYKGRIDITQDRDRNTLTFRDDGIGLSADEAEKYLGTLGIGITGLLKGRGPAPADAGGDGDGLIGQFGIGLFSAFMIADRLAVESRKTGAGSGIRWEAGAGTDIELSPCDRDGPGTTVMLTLKPEFHRFAQESEPLEAAVRAYADFLPVPIFLNGNAARVNVINAAWFDPTPDREAVELELETYFEETPLDVVHVRREKPVTVAGALYFTPQRTPGFAGEPIVSVTVRRMVISRRIQGLVPGWASFLRGVLELTDCTPTLSREDLVRDERFEATRQTVEQVLYEHLERVAKDEPERLQAVLAWHRYTLCGAALSEPRLRAILRGSYRFPTSQGPLTFPEVLQRSAADPLVETEADHVIWYNTDRRQEKWTDQLFAGHQAPCVHALRSFEDSLLAAFAAESGADVDLRVAAPSAPGFAASVLGVHDLEDAPADWQGFLSATGARVLCASFREDTPVMAFLHEGQELAQTFEDLKKQGNIPSGFQRLIDTQLGDRPAGRHELMLNRAHRIVGRALSMRTTHPLASVVRLLAFNALNAAGAAVPRDAQRLQVEDLDWIGEALGGRKS
jgi:molecular chaperone HtpG